MHVMAYFQKWEQLVFPTSLQYHVYDYYQFERLQQIYDNNVFPVIQDQIQYDGITHPPSVWKEQAGHPKKKQFRKQSKFLDPGDSPITCSLCGKSGHNRGHVQRQIWQHKQNSHEAVLAKNKMLDQWVIWYYKILYYSMVRNE